MIALPATVYRRWLLEIADRSLVHIEQTQLPKYEPPYQSWQAKDTIRRYIFNDFVGFFISLRVSFLGCFVSHIHRVLKTLNISFTPGDNCNFHITKHFPCILDSFSKSTLSFLSRQHFSQAHVDLVNCKSERKMMFLKFCLCLRNLSSFFSNANETYAPFKNRS